MKNPVLTSNNLSLKLLLFAAMVLFFSAFKLPLQDGMPELVLRNTPMKFKPDAFYATDVIDERVDKKILGQLVPAVPNGVKTTALPVVLHSGGLVAVAQFIKQNLPYQNGLKPVLIKIKKLSVYETILPDGRVDGKIDLSVAFDLKIGEDLYAHLVNYNGGSHYTRTVAQTDVAEPAIRNTLENAMVFLNNWLIKQADGNPLLAKSVKLTFSDFKEDTPEGDTIYYAANRPITWADFQDKTIQRSRFAAQIMPGLGLAEKTSIKKGVILVDVVMKVYLPKSACWVANGNLDEYTLNHEQRHFDIVKIVSERYKRKMLAEGLPVHNYDGSINVEYFEALREMDRLQKQYDGETGHGTNTTQQQRWDKLIDQELKDGTKLSSSI